MSGRRYLRFSSDLEGNDVLVRDDEGRWLLPCGRLDVGQRKTVSLYITNLTPGPIDEFRVRVEQPVRLNGEPKNGLRVMLLNKEDLSRMPPFGTFIISLEWIADEDVRAGSAVAPLSLTGYVTVEE